MMFLFFYLNSSPTPLGAETTGLDDHKQETGLRDMRQSGEYTELVWADFSSRLPSLCRNII